ncbi:hypothetical protein MRB53_037904 [Persea americana]|nr:hypothetical protein MRB53_037904 [Persea americana]
MMRKERPRKARVSLSCGLSNGRTNGAQTTEDKKEAVREVRLARDEALLVDQHRSSPTLVVIMAFEKYITRSNGWYSCLQPLHIADGSPEADGSRR